MPEQLHVEPFLHLAGLTHDDALIAWGGFWFERSSSDPPEWRIVEDPELAEHERLGRTTSIGAESASYGPAVVKVFDTASGRQVAEERADGVNHVWVPGLQPDTEYRYQVLVDGEPWGEGRLLDGEPDEHGALTLVDRGRRYDNRFRTFPAPEQHAAVTFAVMGDYGIGILASDGKGERQRRVAEALERAVDHHRPRVLVTTGDNIYLGDEDTPAGSGRHDDDWYFSFHQPYRYVINRVPVYPAVGNHDSSDTEQSDDRDQLADNLFTHERFADELEVGRSSIEPGLFYRFSVGADLEFVCIDTTLAEGLDYDQFFQAPEHRDFLEEAFPDHGGDRGPRWLVPFAHHPAWCAGPSHPNMQPMIEHLVPLWRRAGVRLVLAGHEHNFQVSECEGITQVLSGAGGKLREEPPARFAEAGTVAWAAEGHFLLVTVDGDEATVHPVIDVDDDGRLTYLTMHRPGGGTLDAPIHLTR